MEFAEDFEFVTLGKIDEPRPAQIEIKLRRSFARVAPYAVRSVGKKAVAVEVTAAVNIESFAAVGVGDDAELIVVKNVLQRLVVKIKLRAKNQTRYKSMALVGGRNLPRRQSRLKLCCRKTRFL